MSDVEINLWQSVKASPEMQQDLDILQQEHPGGGRIAHVTTISNAMRLGDSLWDRSVQVFPDRVEITYHFVNPESGVNIRSTTELVVGDCDE